MLLGDNPTLYDTVLYVCCATNLAGVRKGPASTGAQKSSTVASVVVSLLACSGVLVCCSMNG